MESKKITIPEQIIATTNAVSLWEVRWQSRYGEFSSDTQPEVEAFPSEEEAESFAEALRNAFRLLKYTHGTEVKLKKAR